MPRRFVPVTPARTPLQTGVLVVCLVTGFATLLDSAVLTVAAPALRDGLGASTAQLQWILAGYSLTFGLALVPAGRLGDRYGRPWFLVAGLVLFALTSIVGASAQGADVLVVARLVQGIGAGTANPQVIGLLQDHFEGPARARSLGAYASTGAFAAVIAPLVGGVVLALAGPSGWRVSLLLTLPFALAAAALCVRLVPRAGRAPVASPGLDPVGLALLSVTALGLLVPFVLAGPLAARAPWGAVVVAGATTLVWWERRYSRSGRTPVLSPELLGAPGFALGCLVATFTFGSALGFSAVLMIYLQEGAGLTALQAGLVTTPGALASVVAAHLSWRLVRRFGRAGVSAAIGAKIPVAVALLLAVLLLPDRFVVASLVVGQVLTGVTGGLSISTNQALTLERAPSGQHGVAAGMLQVSQRLSATVCIAAMTGAFVGVAAGPTGHGAALAGAVVVTALLAVAATACSVLDDVLARRRRARAGNLAAEAALQPA
ncbi:MFS transporter [Oerskovia enterophila]|uniref:MFS transporter n=1 Tax=Oerskovia enterophila TaxID=43678 RepID=UPI00339AB6DA